MTMVPSHIRMIAKNAGIVIRKTVTILTKWNEYGNHAEEIMVLKRKYRLTNGSIGI